MTLLSNLVWMAKAAVYTAAMSAVASPDEFQMSNYENISIRTQDGVMITGYLIKRHLGSARTAEAASAFAQPSEATDPLSNYTLLYLHANAGNMGHRLPIARLLMERLNCNVFMLSYRGYGHSQGTPNEKGIKIDAQAALDYIRSHDKLKNTKVILYGQSIGGAVAINLAAQNNDKISALIIENTFLSLRKLIPHVMKFLRPFTFLCHQIWDSESAIGKVVDVPVLFLSGKRDELIPQQHMIQLHARIIRERTKANGRVDNMEFEEFKDGGHNDTCIQEGYFEVIEKFFVKHFKK
ncbi:hypothetical protein BSLG_003183 [Batrachochytrium salamandrivorans]|nr:hypothetical protein BSLG_003183 [Batrachochytrium salamandrivorans]